jgi:hypothetical protein
VTVRYLIDVPNNGDAAAETAGLFKQNQQRA